MYLAELIFDVLGNSLDYIVCWRGDKKDLERIKDVAVLLWQI